MSRQSLSPVSCLGVHLLQQMLQLVHQRQERIHIHFSRRRGRLVVAATAKAFFSKVPTDELTFDVVSTNEDAEASFPFSLANGKKGAIFDVKLVDDGKFLEAKIAGDFSVDLRSGVAGMLKGVGDQLDLRIRGVMWRGGAYKGFMASVAGGDFEQESDKWAETFPKIASFSVK